MTKTALICDDDRLMARMSKLLLTQLGFAVREAVDGEAALGIIRSEKPDLVLLDLNMPVKSGLEVLSELKAAGHAGSYIIVFSAEEKGALEARVAGTGAHESMTKPMVPAEFSRRIGALLKEGRI